MKALVLTTTQPSGSVHEKQGISRRLGLFVNALGLLDARITMAHLVLPSFATQHEGSAAFQQLQSEFWGLPVQMRYIPRRTRQETWINHYLSGIACAHEQPPVQSFAGPDQARGVAALLDELAPDIVFVHRLGAMLALLRSGRRPRCVFFDLDDIEHRVLARYSLLPPRWLGKLAYLVHIPALLSAELRGAALARLTFVCSEQDCVTMQRLSLGGRFATIPNAVALPENPPPLAADHTILFLGACTYAPNAAAAERLALRILPLVRRQVPDARALIAGIGSEGLPSAASRPEGAEYLGFVADLDALYARSRVICAPIETGGGTRVKLVEAAGYARPMVATRIGAEGLDFTDGEAILLRDGDEQIAEACIRLLHDPVECERLGRAARARARESYDAGRVSEHAAALMRAHLPR